MWGDENIHVKVITFLRISSLKICHKNKILKKEISETNEKSKVTCKEIKSLKKENKDITHSFEKIIGQLELKVENLLDFKAAKAAEERKEKLELKSKSKKLKAIEVEMERN